MFVLLSEVTELDVGWDVESWVTHDYSYFVGWIELGLSGCAFGWFGSEKMDQRCLMPRVHFIVHLIAFLAEKMDDRVTYEIVVIELMQVKDNSPSLYYGLEACPINSRRLGH